MPRAILLIIDLLNDFFERSPVLASDRDRLVAATNRLTSDFRSRGMPVIWVRQEFAPDLRDAFLDMRRRQVSITIAGTPGCEFLPELNRDAGEVTIVKKRYSAFFQTTLDELLSKLQPEILVVAGVNTHACVRMTVIDAYQRDYETVVAAECVASSDVEHHAVSARYLDEAIARFLSNGEITALLDAR